MRVYTLSIASFPGLPPHVQRNTPRLAIFIACYVARVGEGLGTRLHFLHGCINRSRKHISFTMAAACGFWYTLVASVYYS